MERRSLAQPLYRHSTTTMRGAKVVLGGLRMDKGIEWAEYVDRIVG
jgi:hypothetical protein